MLLNELLEDALKLAPVFLTDGLTFGYRDQVKVGLQRVELADLPGSASPPSSPMV